jgi:hypothetical protein
MKQDTIYKYLHNNQIHYCQGSNEYYLRRALATKLKIPYEELNPGIDKLNSYEEYIVSNFRLPYSELDKHLNLSMSVNKSLDEIANLTFNDRNYVINVVSNILRIPKNHLESMNRKSSVKTLVSLSDYKIKIKTTKQPKESKDPKEKKGEVCRVDEIKKHIDMLLSLDYMLIFEIDNIEFENQKAESSIKNLQEKIKKSKQLTPVKEKNILKLKETEEIYKHYNDLYKRYYKRVFSSGYYVSTDYHISDMEELIDVFDEMYQKLKMRLNRHHFNDIVINDELVTLEEKLDSYWLVRDMNNYYQTT